MCRGEETPLAIKDGDNKGKPGGMETTTTMITTKLMAKIRKVRVMIDLKENGETITTTKRTKEGMILEEERITDDKTGDLGRTAEEGMTEDLDRTIKKIGDETSSEKTSHRLLGR